MRQRLPQQRLQTREVVIFGAGQAQFFRTARENGLKQRKKYPVNCSSWIEKAGLINKEND